MLSSPKCFKTLKDNFVYFSHSYLLFRLTIPSSRAKDTKKVTNKVELVSLACEDVRILTQVTFKYTSEQEENVGIISPVLQEIGPCTISESVSFSSECNLDSPTILNVLEDEL